MLLGLSHRIVRTSVVSNAMANFLGRGWATALNLLSVPVYIHLMGIEAYGLIGIFATLEAMLNILDMGLSPAVNREMARYSVLPDKRHEMRDMARTLEIIYWVIGLLAGGVVYLLAYFLATHWVNAEGLNPQELRRAFQVMGVLIVARWPLTFYLGAMRGLERQVLLNIVTSIMATIRIGGTTAALLLANSPMITLFFGCQVIAALLEVGVLVVLLSRTLPSVEHRGVFRFPLLRSIRGFMFGMMGFSLLNLGRCMADRILFSNLMSLEMFGYYSLASVGATGLYQIVGPIEHAILPRFARYFSKETTESGGALSALYHRSSQVFMSCIFPPAVILIIYSQEVLRVWTGDSELSEKGGYFLGLLAICVLFNTLTTMPMAVQKAYGWTSLMIKSNMAACIVLFPVLFFLAYHVSLTSAVAFRAVVFGGYALVISGGLHRRLMVGEFRSWLFSDVGIPALTSFCLCIIARFFIPETDSRFVLGTWLVSICLFALLSTIMFSTYTREFVYQIFRAFLRKKTF